MTFRQTHLLFVIVLIGAISLVAPTALTQESVDFDAVYRIKEEGLKRSEIQEVLSYLTTYTVRASRIHCRFVLLRSGQLNV